MEDTDEQSKGNQGWIQTTFVYIAVADWAMKCFLNFAFILKLCFSVILYSTGEVDIVALHIKALTEAGLQVKDIAVIAPYNLQVSFFFFKEKSKYFYALQLF